MWKLYDVAIRLHTKRVCMEAKERKEVEICRKW